MTLRGALLGAGNIAQLGHLPAYAAIPGGGSRCQIVAAADLREENLRRMATLVPGIRTFRRAEELLDSVRPDFVDICAPPFAHRGLIQSAIDAGCHILCEKPLSLTLEDAEAVVHVIRGAPLVFMPGHQYHYAPAWQLLQAAISGGEIGRLRFGCVTIERQRANDGNRHWNPSWRTCGSFSGGGILVDHGTHLLYQLRTVLGDPLRIAAKIETRRHRSYEVEDTAHCYLEFPEALVRVSLTWAGMRRRTLHRYLGTEGCIASDESCLKLSGPSGSRIVRLEDGFSADSSHADWYAPLLEDFLGRIERSDFDRAPLDEAMATLRCTAAAYESALTGRPVDLSARGNAGGS